jgi:hypothetical protein
MLLLIRTQAPSKQTVFVKKKYFKTLQSKNSLQGSIWGTCGHLTERHSAKPNNEILHRVDFSFSINVLALLLFKDFNESWLQVSKLFLLSKNIFKLYSQKLLTGDHSGHLWQFD